MQLLSTLNSLDNVTDGSTRKLLTTATSSGSGNAVTAVSISGDTLTYTKGSTFSLSNHTHDNATTSKAGFMSAADKTKLNGIETGATATSFTQTLTSGTEVGEITINGTSTKLYAPTPGSVATTLASARQTYYLTGVQTTTAGTTDLYNSYMSSSYTGVKYVTFASQAGGALYVDNKEVVTGLYYEIS
jgi:hypothetical protein